MNSAPREEWPPGAPRGQESPQEPQTQLSRQYASFGASASAQQSQSPASAPVLPPPGSLYSAQPPSSALPHLSGLSQGPQQSPSQAGQSLPSMQTVPSDQNTPQRLQQSVDSERGYGLGDQRQQEAQQGPDIRMREAAEQEREMHDRQRMDAAHTQVQPHENHAGSVPLHQPVAVAPVRSIHGPNGILGGGAAPVNGPMSINQQLGTPAGPSSVYASPHAGQAEPARTQQLQPSTQQPLQQQSIGSNPAVGQAAVVGQGQQPILNDALSYLDQVKVQFADKADVYNKFLDIMKDFKSSAIDTPGVIDRVSNLFAGNPNLIQGFNTFLPPGYKIECGTSDNPNAIRVTTPMGTTTSQLPSRPLSNPRPVALSANTMLGERRGFYEGEARNTSAPWQSQTAGVGSESGYGADRRNGPTGYGAAASLVQGLSAPLSPESQRNQLNMAIMQQEQRGVTQLQDAASVVSAGQGALSQGMQGAAIEKRGPVEFNHAISYVNKIKNRFASQPDIYKQFLEILQTYQRESKPIQEVYGQVTQLFQTAPDLLEDFKQFLPESAAPANKAREGDVPLSHMRGDPGYLASIPNQINTPRADQSRMPPVGNFAPTPNTGREQKRKRQEKHGPASAAGPATIPTGGDANSHSARGGYGQTGHVSKRQKQQHAVKPPTTHDLAPLSPTLVPSLPVPMHPTTTSVATPEDFHFFDRVKKTISNKAAMNEFLKLCNIYSEGLADKNVILARAHMYIGGNPELMAHFKSFIGYGDQDTLIENRPRRDLGRVSLTHCRSYGPSYRKLPKQETQAVCSGRDELCREVLNDEWASHPTWASEDSGFVAHRKNVHEEGLHRIEEERHDYDFNIEACSRTVQLMEAICQQLFNLNPQDRESYELPKTLGGESETIYKRVIMKIYGRDRGMAVIDAMFRSPYFVLPVVYARVKSRLEEWKAAQREWEKVWREQTQKIFWRSLDHQSSNAKNADKRQFQTKTLREDIVARYNEMKEMRQKGTPIGKKYQFMLQIEDEEVLLNAAKLVAIYARHNFSDYVMFEEFLKDFVVTFFGLDKAHVDSVFELEYDESSPLSDEPDGATPGGSNVGHRRVNGRGSSLRKDLLDPQGRKGLGAARQESVASDSRASTPGGTSAVDDDILPSMDLDDDNAPPAAQAAKGNTWLNIISGGPGFDATRDPQERFTRDQFHMYCNLEIYCFVRMLLILYERLNNIKKAEPSVHEQVKKAMAPKPAIDMAMVDKQPTDFFDDVSADANYYDQILGMLEDNVRGEYDMNTIEETLRRYYLESGWQLYSFEKLLSSLARFGVAIKQNPDAKDPSLQIWAAFKKDRTKAETSYDEQLAYRRAVQKLMPKERETFKITYDSPQNKVYISQHGADDPTFNLSDLDRLTLWHAYQATYKEVPVTEGIDASKVSWPFIRLPKLAEGASPPMFDNSEDLKVTVALENYKIDFKSNGSEYLVRTRIEGADPVDLAPLKESKSMGSRKLVENYLENEVWTKAMTFGRVMEVKGSFAEDARAQASSAAVEQMEVEDPFA